MNSIEEQAVEKFQKNLAYFAQKQPNIYKKIEILNKAIENDSYTEKYALEYKKDYFDVLEISSNNYLYNQSSNEHAKLLTKKVNYKKSDSVIESFYNQNITEELVKKYDEKVPIDGALFASAKIIKYTNDITSRNDEMKKIDKFIFCGVGLGLHIMEIQNKISSSQLFIVEDNLELFRLSLFTTNYEKLSYKAELVFSIMENDNDFQASFQNFFTRGYNNNHYLKYTLFSENDMSKIKRIQNFIVTSNYLTYPYSSLLKELLRAPEYLVEQYPFINISNIHLSSPLTKKPTLMIASGPSLERNAQWLQNNKNKFFIISVLSAVKTLNRLEVKPDIVVHIDAQAKSVNLFDGIDKDEFFDKTTFLLSSVVSRTVIDSFAKDRVYCFESASHYKQDYGTLTAPSVGETTYALSLILGSKELYILGLDLALDAETNLSHSKEHMGSRIIENSTPENEQYTSVHNTISYIKGNFLDEVPITPLYRMSVIAFNNFSKEFLLNNQKVFNLNNGAYLEGTIALHTKNINLEELKDINQEDKFKELKLFLDKISEKKVNTKDVHYLDQQIKEATRLLNYVQNFKKTVATNNYEIYMKNFYLLSSELINLSSEIKLDINYILYSYLQYVSSYIFDIFNTKGLKNTKRHLKKINTIFLEQLIKILDLYLTTMKVYRKFAEV